jgi:glycerophosphoryl diester phosphodiesterase
LEFVAHRAGNTVETLRRAQGRADVVEVDVHLVRHGRIEVRHAKRLWPTQRLWERWHLLARPTGVPSLDEIVQAADQETHLWLDLKGPWPRLTRLAIEAVGERRPLTVSSKAWWLLGGLTGTAGVRTLRSAGNRLELFWLLWGPTRAKVDGAVVHRRLLDDRMIDRLRSRGLLFTWAVDDVDTVDWLRGRGVTGVIVDDLSLTPARPGAGTSRDRQGDPLGHEETEQRHG